MPAPSNVLRVITSLRLGERVLVRCGDGLLAAEYALFDSKEAVLRTTDPMTVREAGYMTTAREALGRLAMAGVTAEFAEDAARAIAPRVLESFARGVAARSVARHLGAHELFDGAVYNASSHKYEGVWLDLRAVSSALALPSAAVLLQALHLAAALSEVPPQTPLLLSTAGANRRPGERTHFRMILEGTRWLIDALQRLAPHPHPAEPPSANEPRMREVLRARVRERATPDASPSLRRHLAQLEAALETDNAPVGPMTDADLTVLERQLEGGDTRGIDDRLDQLERERGLSPGIRYLRARAALLRGDEPPASIAQALSQLVDEQAGFHEATLVAARAWLAAGESVRARYFARKLVENAGASDNERLVALEILESTTQTNQSQAPPAVTPSLPPGLLSNAGTAVASPSGTVSFPQNALTHVARIPLGRVPLYPTLGDDLPPPEPSSQLVHVPSNHEEYARPPSDAGRRALRRGRPARYEPELVESLALPLGASESDLGVNELPRTGLQARVAMTRLARDLARDYRLWYAKTLRCNVLAVDAMQQHLANRFAGAQISEPAVAWELRRHGALLSEIISRALGGEWIDVAPSEPGYWAMSIPPSTRSWPIGRVYRFVSLGNRERDLVSYYLDLEARVRGDDVG